MTLNTTIFILDDVRAKDVYAQCGRLIGQHEGIQFTHAPVQTWKDGQHTDSPDEWRIANRLGQGLPAILDVTYRKGGPLKADGNACDDMCETPCDSTQHEPAHWVAVSFDTAYGYRDDQGRGCSDFHADLIRELGAWLEQRGARWMWEDEFTGEVHHGYDGLNEFGRVSAR